MPAAVDKWTSRGGKTETHVDDATHRVHKSLTILRTCGQITTRYLSTLSSMTYEHFAHKNLNKISI